VVAVWRGVPLPARRHHRNSTPPTHPLALCSLRLDQILNGIGLAFVGFEILFIVIAIFTFVGAQRF